MIQQVIKVTKDNAGGSYSALLNLPDDYGTSSDNYPLLVFLHGAGEAGADLSKIYGSGSAGGPAYFIEQGKWPASFVNPVDKKAYKFIVLSPQAGSWSTTAVELDFILKYMSSKYRVDTSRIYLTGLSAGGECVVEYVGKMDGMGRVLTNSYTVAAVAPMSAVMAGNNRGAMAAQIVKDNVRIWGFGSPGDTHGDNTNALVTWYINNIKAGYGLDTTYSGGHCCWNQFYNPTYSMNGMSIYQWMLQYSNTTTPPIVIPPIVVPPVAKTIASVTITYSDGTVETKP